MVIIEGLGLPPVEHRLVLLRSDIHQGCHVVAVVWRNKTIYVSLLHHRADFLIFRYGLAAEVPLLLSHVARLDLHSQTTAHGHVDAVFQRSGAEDGVVRSRTYMGSHGYCREEI